jgi:ferritin
MLIYQYLQDNGETVSFGNITTPEINFENFMEPLQESLNQEEVVTDSINKIYNEAESLKDYRTMQFLDWFIEEQGEEESSAQTLISKMELFGSDSSGLYLLDNELAKRKYVAPNYGN